MTDTMATSEIVFYDLASRIGEGWSMNPWKTRLTLNYKGLPYRTEFIEYPDLKPTLQKLGVPPNDPTFANWQYTSPTIRLPSGQFVMESGHIIQALNKAYPEPPLPVESQYQAKIEKLIDNIVVAAGPILLPKVPPTFLNQRSKEYWIPDRENTWGMSIDDFAKGGGPHCWQNVEPNVKQMGEMYKENSDGPYLTGKQPCYADIHVLAFLRMMIRMGFLDKFYEMEGGDQLRKLYEASGQWLERDSY